MSLPASGAVSFPVPLSQYPPPASDGLLSTLLERIELVPFNAVATGIFFLAILHTFLAARFVVLAHRVRHRQEARQRAAGVPVRPSVAAELLHFFGEVEVVFGLWALVLACAMAVAYGWDTVVHYLDESVNYTEPLFVVVIMALASTRPIVVFAERSLAKVAHLGGGTPSAWWLSILTLGPVLGSFITEPAAMTICALLLGRQFYDLGPSRQLQYATLGLLFVNVSIGGTLTHFAAPPVLMVARPWEWDLTFMLTHFGWRAVTSIVVSNFIYFVFFRRELRALSTRSASPDIDVPEDAQAGALFPVPSWLITVHVLFMLWTVFNAHLVAAFLTAFNDNALITYLATLVPSLSDAGRIAVVGGAVAGGGLTVIANAPNPAGQSILGRFFDGAIAPSGLALGALIPTLVAVLMFHVLP
jgi:hypothetical protein